MRIDAVESGLAAGEAGSGMNQVEYCVVGADGGRIPGARMIPKAGLADRNEPRQHDRSEDVADETGSFAPDQEKTGQDCDRDRNGHWRKPGRADLETFDSAEDRDRRSDHAATIEQRATVPARIGDLSGLLVLSRSRPSTPCSTCLGRRFRSEAIVVSRSRSCAPRMTHIV